jgi:hypothetical protein
MNGKGLTKLYDQLTPRERMPLLIAAADRSDDEAAWLGRSAARIACLLPDYHGLGDGLMVLTHFHATSLLDKAANFWHVIAALGESSRRLGEDPARQPVVARLEGVASLWAHMYAVEEDAWTRLMAEMGIDPESLLRDLPCFDTIQGAVEVIRPMAFTEAEAAAYLREHDKGTLPATVEGALAAMRTFLDGRVEWWQ